MGVVVLGSINMDMVARVGDAPTAGQTITGESFEISPGGKGANQAVAAAKAGADVNFIGRVGNDVFAEKLITSLQNAGVNTDCIIASPDVSSGVAQITITADSQNRIIVIPGANGSLDGEDIKNLKKTLAGATSLLLQLEVPMETNIAAAKAARQAGVRVILDPAPAAELPAELLDNVDVITPNQSEAEAITGIAISNFADAAKAIEKLYAMGIELPIIKMGKQGVCWLEDGAVKSMKPFDVKVVDTVAAGDAVNGGLAAALDEGKSISEAIKFSQATAALAVTRHGAQQAMPTKTEIEKLI